MEDVEDRVREVIVDKLGVPRGMVTASADIQNDLGADSLDSVEILIALEDEFNIEIDDNEADRWKTVSDVVKSISAKA